MDRVPICKYCGSTRTVKYGIKKNVQRWWCKACRRKFVDNDALPGMRVGKYGIAYAINAYYDGSSVRHVCRELGQQFGVYPSQSTVYRWIFRFTKQAIERSKIEHVSVGDRWQLMEATIDVGRKRYKLSGLLDEGTRFLLAATLAPESDSNTRVRLIDAACIRCGRMTPGVIVGESAGSLDICTELLQSVRTGKSMQLILDGWLFHYNFIKSQDALGQITPAIAAGTSFSCRDWQEFIAKSPG